MKNKEQKRKEAEARQAIHDKRTFEEKVRRAGARERARLLKRGR